MLRFAPAARAAIASMIILGFNPMLVSNATAVTDSDGDGVVDSIDNCILIVNPLRRDTDSDGLGNFCDPDFDNNMIVNAADLAYQKAAFFTSELPRRELS